MATVPCAVYDFRANETTYDIDELKQWLKNNCKKWVFQKEKGDSGYIHWQGRFSLIKKRKKFDLLKLFTDIQAPNYLEPTTTEEHRKTAFYCLKEDTRLEGPFKDTDIDVKPAYIPVQYRNVKLYEWQQYIINDTKQLDFRTINMIYDPKGNNGKSTLASIAELIHGCVDLPPINDFKELIALLCNICMDRDLRTIPAVFIDMPRALRKDQLYGMYSAIEQIKKGKLYDMRYHYKSWWIDSPAVWVFSNTLPDMEYLSLDRWKIWQIKNNKLVPFPDEDPAPFIKVEKPKKRKIKQGKPIPAKVFSDDEMMLSEY